MICTVIPAIIMLIVMKTKARDTTLSQYFQQNSMVLYLYFILFSGATVIGLNMILLVGEMLNCPSTTTGVTCRLYSVLPKSGDDGTAVEGFRFPPDVDWAPPTVVQSLNFVGCSLIWFVTVAEGYAGWGSLVSGFSFRLLFVKLG